MRGWRLPASFARILDTREEIFEVTEVVGAISVFGGDHPDIAIDLVVERARHAQHAAEIGGRIHRPTPNVGAQPEVQLEARRERLQSLPLIVTLNLVGFAEQPIGLESEPAVHYEARLQAHWYR